VSNDNIILEVYN